MGQFFAWVAVATGVMAAWPQVARIVLRKDDTGVSLLSRRLAVCSVITWVGIGIVNGITSTIVYNAVALIGKVSTLVVIERLHDRSLKPVMTLVAGAALGCITVNFVFGDVGIELTGAASGMSMVLGQVWKSAVMYNIPGVSPVTWLLTMSSNICWTVFGITINEWVLIYPTVILITGSAFVFFRSYQSNRRLKHCVELPQKLKV